MSSNQIRDLNKIYMEAVYGQSPEKEEAKRRKDDDLAGSPRKATPESGTGKYYKEGQPTKQQLAQREKREKIKSLTNQGKHKEASALHNEGLGTAGAALVGPMVGVNPAIAAGTTGAITGKKGRKTKKAVAAGTGAAVGGAMAGPVGAAIGAGVGGALADEVKHVRKLVEKVKHNKNPEGQELEEWPKWDPKGAQRKREALRQSGGGDHTIWKPGFDAGLSKDVDITKDLGGAVKQVTKDKVVTPIVNTAKSSVASAGQAIKSAAKGALSTPAGKALAIGAGVGAAALGAKALLDKKDEKKKEKTEESYDPGMEHNLAVLGMISEKQKDTPDQVKAVIAYDKARKGTDDATYDSEHGEKKKAKKERDYAKWQRDKGAEDAQKSGHPWEHAKGSTREKEGKKSVKHAHIKDEYESFINKLEESGKFSGEQIDEVVGALVGGALGTSLGGKYLGSKVGQIAGKAIGGAVGAGGGEMLDPFKKGKDKNVGAAALGGGAAGAVAGGGIGAANKALTGKFPETMGKVNTAVSSAKDAVKDTVKNIQVPSTSTSSPKKALTRDEQIKKNDADKIKYKNDPAKFFGTKVESTEERLWNEVAANLTELHELGGVKFKVIPFDLEEDKKWIQGAVKRPGAFTKKAKAAGMSVQQFAKHVDANKDDYSTRTERQANLAQTFASMKKEDADFDALSEYLISEGADQESVNHILANW